MKGTRSLTACDVCGAWKTEDNLWRCVVCRKGPACATCVERLLATGFDGYLCDCCCDAPNAAVERQVDRGDDDAAELTWPAPFATDFEA